MSGSERKLRGVLGMNPNFSHLQGISEAIGNIEGQVDLGRRF